MHLVAAHSHTLHSAPFFLWLPVLCLLNRSILRFRGHYLPNNATSPNQLGITGFSPNPASNTEPLFILPLYWQLLFLPLLSFLSLLRILSLFKSFLLLLYFYLLTALRISWVDRCQLIWYSTSLEHIKKWQPSRLPDNVKVSIRILRK